jgi:L-threonylcarbamoyladenylate synthase
MPVRQAIPVPWGLLSFRGEGDSSAYAHVEILSPDGDLREAAANLFAKLRALDARGLKKIIAESVPDFGLGSAILDRLRKAAGNG